MIFILSDLRPDFQSTGKHSIKALNCFMHVQHVLRVTAKFQYILFLQAMLYVHGFCKDFIFCCGIHFLKKYIKKTN